MEAREQTNCRICLAPLPDENLLDLGVQLVSDFPKLGEEPTRRGPLQLVRCRHCELVQLRHTTPRDWHYKGDYWYLSGVNESMVDALRDVVRKGGLHVDLRAGDAWIDIGANDGTLLRHLAEDVLRIAVEPVPQFGGPLEQVADMVMPTYWPTRYDGPKAKVITSIAMFYDLDDPHEFVEAIRQALHPEGVWVVQYADLQELYVMTDLGTICHEHLCYYSLPPVENLLRMHGLGVVMLERNSVNGGSVRLYVKHEGRSLLSYQRRVLEQARLDDQTQCGPRRDMGFQKDVWQAHARFWHAWHALQHPVDLYGASTKGNTLLQLWRLGPDQVRQAIERSPAKYGRTTITGIPIVSEASGREDRANVWLVLPWHFRKGIIRREREYLESGGRLLFPLPWAELVGREALDAEG